MKETFLEYNRCCDLCNAWNRASDPGKQRTEAGHRAAQKAARKFKSTLFREFREGRDFKEMSNGAFWPIESSFDIWS